MKLRDGTLYYLAKTHPHASHITGENGLSCKHAAQLRTQSDEGVFISRLRHSRCFLAALLVLLLAALPSQSLSSTTRGIVSMAVKNKAGKRVTLYKESHALVIGVSEYNRGWPQLPGVKKDVQAVRDVLIELGFHVVMVEDPDPKELEAAYKDFVLKYGLDPENRLLFYYAGHGHTHKPEYATNDPEEWMGYLVARDAPDPKVDLPNFFKHALSMRSIEGIALTIESKHALFVFDSCFSGTIFGLTRDIPKDIQERTAKPVRQFITSGTADQVVPDISIFRRQFVSALEGEADRNKDGYVTGTELGLFMEETVTNLSRRTQTPRYGKIQNRFLNKGDFVFPIKWEAVLNEPVPSEDAEDPGLTEDPQALIQYLMNLSKNPQLSRGVGGRDKKIKKHFSKLRKLDNLSDTAVSVKTKIKLWKDFIQLYPTSNPHLEEAKSILEQLVASAPPEEDTTQQELQAEFARLMAMDQQAVRLDKKIDAWEAFLEKYPTNNPKKDFARFKIDKLNKDLDILLSGGTPGSGATAKAAAPAPSAEQTKMQEKEKQLAQELEALKKEQARIAEKKKQLADKLEAQRKEQQRLAEERRLAAEREAKRIAEEKRLAAEREARLKEEKRLAEERRLAAEREAKRIAEEKRLAEQKRLAEEAEAKRIAEEKRLAEERRLAAELDAKIAEQKRLAEERRLAQEAEAKRRAEEFRLAEEKRLAEEAEAKRKAEEKRLAQKKRLEEERQARIQEEKRREEAKLLQQQQQAKKVKAEVQEAEKRLTLELKEQQMEQERIDDEKRKLAEELEAIQNEQKMLAEENRRLELERHAQILEEARLAEEKRLLEIQEELPAPSVVPEPMELARYEPPADANDASDAFGEMVLIPSGTFQLTGGGEKHREFLGDFYMDAREVTQAEFLRVMGTNPSHFKGDALPVEQVTWEEANQYCAKIGKRLPTSAEWEKAARSGKKTKYFWGDRFEKNRANCTGCGSDWDGSKTAPVGSFPPNDWGLYDMAGNVWEWVQDTHDEIFRVLRGGSWMDDTSFVHAGGFYFVPPENRSSDIGFRCAVSKENKRLAEERMRLGQKGAGVRTAALPQQRVPRDWEIPLPEPASELKTSAVAPSESQRDLAVPSQVKGMVRIEAGKFKMGSANGDADESPVHTVYLDTYLIDKTEVTQKDFEEVMGFNPAEFKRKDGPVDNVTWKEASQYCEKVGKRLPTEAEWERAARAGTDSKYYWGNDADAEYGWWGTDDTSWYGPHPVAKKQPNALGLHDMAGNVWEWVADWFEESYYKGSPDSNPKGPATGTQKVLRGGGWDESPAFVRMANRAHSAPAERYNVNGFRCAKTP